VSIIPFGAHTPRVSKTAFIAPDAWIIGDVEIAERVSIFFNAVLRGDIESIRVGAGSNLQEHVLVHTSHGLSPAIIGENVTVGHRAIVHGAKVENCCLIGMGATLLDDSVVGEYSLIGAHALVPKGMIIPPGSLVMGTPAKVVRSLTEAERAGLVESALGYQQLGARYIESFANR
jgi:carbonic anhydrase/acetyltransferase-like protein (isoleucine patch superfamily)